MYKLLMIIHLFRLLFLKKEDLLYSENFLKNLRLKFILLNVSAAFHSNLMKKAEEKC